MTMLNNTMPREAAGSFQAELAAKLTAALQSTMFTSTLRIAPRRIHQLAQEFAIAFGQFQERQAQVEIAYTSGQRLAEQGIGHDAILALVDVLHRVCWASAELGDNALPTSVAYSGRLLAGYMAGREASLLREQERTRLALDRARAKDAQ